MQQSETKEAVHQTRCGQKKKQSQRQKISVVYPFIRSLPLILKLKPDDFECSLLIDRINEFRNLLLLADMPTEDVDEFLLKLIDKSEKKRQVNIHYHNMSLQIYLFIL